MAQPEVFNDFFRVLVGWLLIEAEDVAAWITKPCGDLGSVGADGLDQFAAAGGNLFDRAVYDYLRIT